MPYCVLQSIPPGRMACNELFQYSIISALMDGVADRGIPIATVLAHGDHGLGTFRHMDGEMIILAEGAYRMRSDGSVSKVDDVEGVITPFAQVTRFATGTRARVAAHSKSHLYDLISGLVPTAANRFLAIRVQGVFRTVNVRTAGGQKYPRQGLVEVGEGQTEHEFSSLRGVMVGFRCPHWTGGVGVPGDHLHFVDEERRCGGHVLGLETDGEVDVEVAEMWDWHVELPRGDEDFDRAALLKDEAGIAKVEG